MHNDKLQKYLDSKKCFVLICGAGNKNYDEITKLCALYAAAGCRFFDINASVEAIRAAKKGFKFVNKEHECFICVSVGTKDDPHLSKCKINTEKCVSCGSCAGICLQKAINQSGKAYNIDENKCIGCGKCINVCPAGSITRYSKGISFSEILPPLIQEGIDCIEYHIITDNEEEVMQGWAEIVKQFDGLLSVCLDRSKWGNEKLAERLKIMKKHCNNIFMVQADGSPMSGGNDDYRTTLQAVATADIVEKADITPYIIMSGGTNSKTMELANLCKLGVSGVAVGSYARKIVKDYLEKDDFLSNKEIFIKALNIAKGLINKVR